VHEVVLGHYHGALRPGREHAGVPLEDANAADQVGRWRRLKLDVPQDLGDVLDGHVVEVGLVAQLVAQSDEGLELLLADDPSEREQVVGLELVSELDYLLKRVDPVYLLI
jgi:hypothetical protein